jgi:DNA-binding NarL/FixJ family response regulator
VIERAAQSEAVRLFVERARAVRPSFCLTAGRLAIVEQICRRLDGMPLAIELAAARVAILTPEQIADRLCDRFRLLTEGSRTALPRSRTLRAMIDWSHDLLDEPEQILLRRLAVFTGGWTLDAAETVCIGDGLGADDILDVLSGLASKSLILTVEHPDEVRYSFLESLREYAAEKLRAAGEESILQERHRAWFLALAERAAPELRGPHQDRWLDRLDRERENLRAVQRNAVARGDAETTARLGGALWLFWWARADAAETHEWINSIAPLVRQARPTRVLAQALHGAGMLAGSLADFPSCRSLLQEALAVARQVGDRPTLAAVLDSFGRQLSFEGRYDEARLLLTESLAIHHDLDDRQALASALSRFGFLVYLEGDHAAARATLDEGLTVARTAGDPAMVAEILDKQGQISHSDGDLPDALRCFQQAEKIWRELGQGHWLAMTLNNLGNTQTLLGELDAARDRLAEALGLSQRLGNRRRMAFTLSSVATLMALEGDPARALRLDAASMDAVAQMGIRRVPPRVPLRAQILERARQALGATAVAAAVADGHALPLAQAVEEALSWLAEPRPSVQVDRSASPGIRQTVEERPVRGSVMPIPASTPTPAAVADLSRRAPAVATLGAPGWTLPRKVEAPAVAATKADLPPPARLSPREVEVLRLVAAGRTSKEVADDLVLSVRTVERHISHIYEKIGARCRADATLFALRHQIVT